MELTKENIYISLQGKSKEELTELYWLLKNNNEEILNDGLDVFIKCYLNLKSKDYKFHFYSNCWSLACSSVDISKKEITIQQLKEILQPMEGFTPIAMRCTQEQFNAVKPKLKSTNIHDVNFFGFIRNSYLTNNLDGKNYVVNNIPKHCKRDYNREIHEYWNEEIFLKACGIETEQTLTEQLEKAEAEVKRLKESIEEENNIKVGDWVVVKETKEIFKVDEVDIEYLESYHEKITNQELIKLLEQEIK